MLEVAPHKYKMSQMALLGRAEAFGMLGRREEQRQSSIQARFPGSSTSRSLVELLYHALPPLTNRYTRLLVNHLTKRIT